MRSVTEALIRFWRDPRPETWQAYLQIRAGWYQQPVLNGSAGVNIT